MAIIFLEVNLPGRAPQLGGFVVVDRDGRRVCVRFRSSWELLIDPIDAEVLSGYSEVLESFFESMDFDAAVSAILELSNVVRASSALNILNACPIELFADKLSALLLN